MMWNICAINEITESFRTWSRYADGESHLRVGCGTRWVSYCIICFAELSCSDKILYLFFQSSLVPISV
jgi:hypothetical protein